MSFKDLNDANRNGPIESFFRIFKTELINSLDMSKITFNELKEIIDHYIWEYNNIRKIKKFGWLEPTEFQSKFNNR